MVLGREIVSISLMRFTSGGLESLNEHFCLESHMERSSDVGATSHLKSLICQFPYVHSQKGWCPYLHILVGACDKKEGWKNEYKYCSQYHSNQSCRVPHICVRVYWLMEKMNPSPVDLEYIWLLHVGTSIINRKEFLLLLWFLEHLCSLIYDPSLSLLMYFTPYSIFLQPLHLLFLLVFFLLSWTNARPNFLSILLEIFTLYCCYCILEGNEDIPVKHPFFTGHLFAYNNILKKSMIFWTKHYPHVIALE